MKTFISIILIVFALNTTAQKSLSSSKNIVTIANGSSTSVSNQKQLYFYIALYSSPMGPNDIGRIDLMDAPWEKGGGKNYNEKFTIYNAKLNDNGVYYYWTIDIGNDGQIVLFQVDNNSAVPTITVSRYSPSDKSKVLKQIIYYID